MDSVKKSFYKELAIVTIIFLAPLLGYLHTLEPEGQLREITLFGWRYVHGYVDDQFLLYCVLRLLLVGALYGIWYVTAKSWQKFFLLFPIWLIISKFFMTIFPATIYKSTEGYLNVVIGFVLVLYYVLTERNSIVAAMQTVKNHNLVHWVKIPCKQKAALVGLVIMATPFFHEIWRLIPEGTKFLDFYFLHIDDLGFGDFNTAVYYLISKIAYFFPFVVWFFVEKLWWRYALLSPIIVNIFQIVSILDPNHFYMDEFELYKAAYLITTLAIFIVFLSKAAYHQSYLSSLYNKICLQREQYLMEKQQKKDFPLKQKWKQLQKMEENGDERDIKELETLKQQLEERLAHL